MRVIFNTIFKDKIQELGSTVKLMYFKGTDGKYYSFDALWYEENKTLNITLDLSELPDDVDLISELSWTTSSSDANNENEISERISQGTGIQIFYSNLNDEIKGEAFKLIFTRAELDSRNRVSSDSLSRSKIMLSREKRDNNLTRDLNHITVFFPDTTVANIETNITNTNSKFIEQLSWVPGINTFLAYEGNFNDSDYLTKNTYSRWARNQISLKNNDPVFLDLNGEKILNIGSYKHYKSIYIEAANSRYTLDEDTGIFVYYVSNGSTAGIVGRVTYDLYQNENGIYTKLKSDLTEDLTVTTLHQITRQDDEVTILDTPSNCEINQFDKSIRFLSNLEKEVSDYLASLSFVSEITDPLTGSEPGDTITLRSNIIEFVAYLRWGVEYPSNFVRSDEDSTVLIIMDSAGSTTKTWNPDLEERREATILIYSQSELKRLSLSGEDSDITITQEDPSRRYSDEEAAEIFFSYFEFVMPTSGVWDSFNQRWVYEVKIRTLVPNNRESDPNFRGLWYPLTEDTRNGESILILNTIKVRGTIANSVNSVKFYCIQRPEFKLDIYREVSTNNLQKLETDLIEFEPNDGIKRTDKLYVVNSVNGYDKWEIEYRDKDSDVIISSQFNSIVSYDDISNPETRYFYGISRVPYSELEDVDLGYVIFKRRSSEGTYDRTKWLDAIYCSDYNNYKLNFKIKKGSDTIWSLVPTPNYINYPDTPAVATKYYYHDATSNSYHKLFIFNPGESRYFRINYPNSGATLSIGEGSEISTSNDSNSAFTMSIRDGGNGYADIVITAKTESTLNSIGYNRNTWFPKIGSDDNERPARVIFMGGAGEDPKEIIYCVIRPQFDNFVAYRPVVDEDNHELVGYEEADSIEFNKTQYQYVDEEQSKVEYYNYLYIASDVVSGEFGRWIVFNKDSELSVKSKRVSGSEIKIYGINSGKIISSDTTTWENNEIPQTFVSTVTDTWLADDMKFEELVIQMVVSAQGDDDDADYKITNHLDQSGLLSDWRNQLVEDYKIVLPVTLDGTKFSDSLQVFGHKSNTDTTNLVEFGEGVGDNGKKKSPYLELDYIGLYKIFVKSTSKFRVALENFNSMDNFFFYDVSTDTAKRNILTIDENTYDSVSGSEVVFVFYGNELDTFYCKDQVLRTLIRVTNMKDNTSMVIPLHRKYFLRPGLNIAGEVSFNSPVIDSNIKNGDGSEVTAEHEIVLLNSAGRIVTGLDPNNSKITYLSNLDTTTTYIENVSNGSKVDPNIVVGFDNVYGNITTRYASFYDPAIVNTRNKSTTIGSRGYIMHELGVTLSVKNNADTSFKYPLIPSGTIKVQNSGYLPKLNYQEKSIDLYRLRSGPYISTTNSYLRLPYKANVKTENFFINTNNYFYEVYLGVGNNDPNPKRLCIVENNNTVDAWESEDFNDPKTPEDKRYGIRYDSAERKWSVWSTGGNYEQEDGVTYIAGTLIFKTYVRSNDFIEDLNENRILGKFSQDYIDSTLIPNNVQTVRVEIARLSKKESTSDIEALDENNLSRFGTGFNESFYVYDPDEANIFKGEATWRSFNINLSDSNLTVNIDSLLNDNLWIIKNAEYYGEDKILRVEFFDKIHRYYNTGLLDQIFQPSSSGTSIYKNHIDPSSPGTGIRSFFQGNIQNHQFIPECIKLLYFIQKTDDGSLPHIHGDTGPTLQMSIPIRALIEGEPVETQILQEGWKKGIAVNSTLYLGFGDLVVTKTTGGVTTYTKTNNSCKIEIIDTTNPFGNNDPNYQYSTIVYMCQALLPESDSGDTAKIFPINDDESSSQIFAKNGNDYVNIEINSVGINGIDGLKLIKESSNNLYSQDINRTSETTVVPGTDGINGSNIIGGYKWCLRANKNATRNTRTGSMIVKDNYGNRVTFNITQPGTLQDEMYAFKEYDSGTHEARWGDLITETNPVIFSANGEMLYQDYIYILTTDSESENFPYYWYGAEYLESSTTYSYSTINIYDINDNLDTEKVREYPPRSNGVFDSSVNCSMTTKADWVDGQYGFENNGKIVGSGNSYLSNKTWRVYRVKLSSKINYYNLYKNENEPEDYMSGLPFKRDFGIYRASNRSYNSDEISTTIYAAYGVCYLRFVDASSFYVDINNSFAVDFGDTTNYVTAYANGSLMAANTGKEYMVNKNYYRCTVDDTLYLRFDDDSSLRPAHSTHNEPIHSISENWWQKGYYSAWKLDCIRKEWNQLGTSIVDLGGDSGSYYDRYIGYYYDSESDKDNMSLGIVREVSPYPYAINKNTEFDYPGNETNRREGLLIKTSANKFTTLVNKKCSLKNELIIKTTIDSTKLGQNARDAAKEYKFKISIELNNINPPNQNNN